MRTRLDTFNNDWYKPGAGWKRALWYITSSIFFETGFPISFIKVVLLRLFGAKVGQSVVIKPRVRIKYPWFLEIGNHVWIGEAVWIDNLAEVKIGDHACVSQGAMLLCGNHNYKKSSFDLIVKSIILEEGSWVGAQSVVCPGVTLHSHSILTVGSVAASNMEPYFIYSGNPAVKIRERRMKE